MAKGTAARGFTLAEKRALLFEQVSLYAVFLVALIAAAISFIALRAVGADAGLGRAAFLLPIAIDGFGIACSVGIVRSVASGERFRDRASEWVGLFAALALSILGNVHHALMVGAETLPDYVKYAYAAAIPLIVAYGIHVYGRAMSKGISAHVLADNPDELVFDMRHLGDSVAARRAPMRATRRQPTVRTPATPTAAERTERAGRPAQQPVSAPAQPSAPPVRTIAPVSDPAKERARAIFDRMVLANPIEKPDAAAIHREAEVPKAEATTRRWVQAWWTETEASMGMAREPLEGPQNAAESVTRGA